MQFSEHLFPLIYFKHIDVFFGYGNKMKFEWNRVETLCVKSQTNVLIQYKFVICGW